MTNKNKKTETEGKHLTAADNIGTDSVQKMTAEPRSKVKKYSISEIAEFPKSLLSSAFKPDKYLQVFQHTISVHEGLKDSRILSAIARPFIPELQDYSVEQLDEYFKFFSSGGFMMELQEETKLNAWSLADCRLRFSFHWQYILPEQAPINCCFCFHLPTVKEIKSGQDISTEPTLLGQLQKRWESARLIHRGSSSADYFFHVFPDAGTKTSCVRKLLLGKDEEEGDVIVFALGREAEAQQPDYLNLLTVLCSPELSEEERRTAAEQYSEWNN